MTHVLHMKKMLSCHSYSNNIMVYLSYQCFIVLYKNRINLYIFILIVCFRLTVPNKAKIIMTLYCSFKLKLGVKVAEW